MDKQEKIDKLKQALIRYEGLIEEQFNKEQAIKLNLNSIYGSFGSPFFTFFNTDIAEAITLQAKETNLYAEKVINHYFSNLWINDTELHEKLGLKIINENVVSSSVSTIYMDTDSTFSLSVLYTSIGKLYIKDLFTLLKKQYTVERDFRGNEIININSDITVLNFNSELEYAPIKKLIRHKVTKSKWVLKSKTGKQITVTGDHSLIVFRNGIKTVVKANEINIKNDKILTINHIGLEYLIKNFEYQFEEIEFCEKQENGFENEYVYDIEVDSDDDSNRTFIANDILVHNSCYATFDYLFKSTNYKETKYKDNEIQLILDIYEFRFKDYLQKAFDKFAELRNTDNYQKFEMESIAEKGIWLGKKKYFQDVVWEDPGTISKSLANIKSKGIEVIQSSTPTIIRKELKDILKFFLTAEKIKMDELVEWLKRIKKKFVEEPNIENKCKNIKINNYEKYCVDDTYSFKYGFKCPVNVRAAIYHNYLINTNNINDKYDLAVSGNKVKFYYCIDNVNEVFAFNPGAFPTEIAPPFDDNTMFYKVVLVPINSILESLKMPLLDENLHYKKPLF